MSERLTVGVAARLSRYLQVLTQAKKMGRSSISSQDVSEYTHINATQIRRDLSAFGKFGKRGVGYNIDALIAEIRGHPAHLRPAQHRARRRGPARPGDRRLVDLRRPRLPHRHDLRRRPREDRHRAGRRRRSARPASSRAQVAEHNIIAAVIAVPAGAAQTVADQLVKAGVHIIFNYSEALLQTPADVDRAQLEPGGRAPARALLLPHVAPAAMRFARARARPPSRRSRAAANATSGTAHSPVDQPKTQARPRRRKYDRRDRSTASGIGRSLPASVCRSNALVALAPMGQSIPDPFAALDEARGHLRPLAGSHPRDRGGVPDRRPRDARPRQPLRRAQGAHRRDAAGRAHGGRADLVGDRGQDGPLRVVPEAARAARRASARPARRGRRASASRSRPAARTPGRRGGSRRSSTRPTTASSRARCATSPGATTRSGSTSTSACSDADRAIALDNAMRSVLPDLLALSASSPWYEGRYTHLHSTRTPALHAHVPALRHPGAVRRLGRLRPLRALAGRDPARSASTRRSGGACARTSPTGRSSCATPTRSPTCASRWP